MEQRMFKSERLAMGFSVELIRGHRRIFPKLYAKAVVKDLLPFDSIGQPNCETKFARFFSARGNLLRKRSFVQHADSILFFA